VSEVLVSKQITVLEHPPYSPDLASSNFSVPEDKINIGRKAFLTLITWEYYKSRRFHKMISKIVFKGGPGAIIGA
jgi:hypothetical protein